MLLFGGGKSDATPPPLVFLCRLLKEIRDSVFVRPSVRYDFCLKILGTPWLNPLRSREISATEISRGRQTQTDLDFFVKIVIMVFNLPMKYTATRLGHVFNMSADWIPAS